MFCHWLNFLPCFLAVLHFYEHFCHLEGKNLPKTYMGLYLPFQTTKWPGQWINFHVLAMSELCLWFLGSFWTVIMVSTGISVIWRHNGTKYPKYLEDWSYFMYFQWLNLVTCFLTVFALSPCFLQAFLSFGDKTASQNTYWAASILPGNKNSWETGTFWSSSKIWTLCIDFQQCLDCYCSFACISPICMEKHAPPSTIGPYLPFLTRQTPGRWIIFDLLPIT